MRCFIDYLIYILLMFSFSVFAKNTNYFDTFPYHCGHEEQPSSIPYFKQFSPHMLQYAVDIDFVVKQTGVCTSLLIALIEQESGLVRRHTLRRKPWIRPFGALSNKLGFVAQLVDVATKLRELKNRSYTGYLPPDEKMAYLFDVQMPATTPQRLMPDNPRVNFNTLYRDMFMLEFRPLRYLHPSDFGLKQDFLLRSWQFRQNVVGSIFAITK